MTKSSHHQSPPDVDIEPRPLPRSTVWLMAITVGVIVANIYYAQPLSTWDLVVRHSTLRESSILGALFFAAFSAFWTNLVFFLQSPSCHYGSAAVAGMFGLVGAAGALCAPGIGHLAHKHGPRFTIRIALWVALLSFAFMALAGKHLAGLIMGVVLMDLGVQSGRVSNQTRIYGIDPNARSRLNTVYMVCYFVGEDSAPGSVRSAGTSEDGWVFAVLAWRRSQSESPSRGSAGATNRTHPPAGAGHDGRRIWETVPCP